MTSHGGDFIGALRAIVRGLLKEYRLPQKAIITSYDPAKHMAKASLQPEGLETPWMQCASSFAGSGFGAVSGLSVGTEVMVAFEGGDINSGVIMCALHNGQDLPVLTKDGETKLIHPSGSYLKFFADGTIEISSPTEIKLLAPNLKAVTTTELLLDTAGVFIDNHNAAVVFGPPAVPTPTFNAPLHVAESIPHPDI